MLFLAIYFDIWDVKFWLNCW